ncbi:unnamed protein product [Linum tenue]|uniref:Uncharacterized protein n=1 Tax=Linum tenue TaxID=586396 RepID=A0AAV0GVD7_9ROSI|nr:unnamed protein product [Linum tenue]
MAANAVIQLKPNIHPRDLRRLRPQPGLLRLLLQGRHRLLLERRPEAATLNGPDLHGLLLHPLGHETPLGPPHRRFPRRRVQAAAVLRGGGGIGICFRSGGGAGGGIARGGGADLPGGRHGRNGDRRCDDRCVYCEEQHRN